MSFLRICATVDERSGGLAQPSAEPATGERTLRLADGTEVGIRALTPALQEAVRDLHERCTLTSQWFRYFTAMPTLPQRMFDRLCDRSRGRSIVACHDGRVRALANLMHCADPDAAELALLVEDSWQGRGLGTQLARLLIDTARDHGFTEVRATILSNNRRMLRLMTNLGATFGRTDEPGVIEARLTLAATV